ncbi:hypothetical protein ALC56_12254 [Trachymyrmex septentrionalis]|uniref:Uncharacterized protein n=1 Tax=Trachymyrmex septentrionalis TaxID=34720 RepID=A0A195F056_9HYME|nr:PREDICTED: uncharacterized protein LOC108753476 [Trachymyrmex septentrionalis]KYN33542.1 hypothetical protein ALC56_12254 [Trachymyrmex septentrionalis]
MRIIALVLFLVLGLALHAHCMAMERSKPKEEGILECIFTNNARSCLRTRLARDLDQIELEVTGKKSEPPMSAVIEQAGNVIAEVVDDLQENNAEEIIKEDDAQNDNIEEARKKKFKKKHLQKILGLVMLLKAKLSLLLQLISTHFQFKFFIIAIISLILNAARFWIEIKKPSKVIYYEHAQHQHHYDHDDHGYWGRSSNETPHELAYRSYAPTD